MRETVGISNKLVATLYGAVGPQVIAMFVNFIASGAFDRTEAAQLLGIALTAVCGFLLGYSAEADQVVDVTAEG